MAETPKQRAEREERERKAAEAAAAARKKAEADAAADRAEALRKAAAAAAAAQPAGFTPPRPAPAPITITPLPQAGNPPDTMTPAPAPEPAPLIVADIASIQVPKGLGAPGRSINPDHDAGILSPKTQWINIWNYLGAAFNGLEKAFGATEVQMIKLDHVTTKVTGP
jgi:hypothetical protein